MQVVWDPYRNPRMDVLERISLYGTVGLTYIALYLSVNSIDDASKYHLCTMLVGMNGCLLAWFIWAIVREFMLGKLQELDVNEDGYVSRDDVIKVGCCMQCVTQCSMQCGWERIIPDMIIRLIMQ